MHLPTSTTLLFSLLLAVTKAQNLGAEPACATACLSSAIVAAGCALTDQGCQCGPTQAAIGAKAEPCLLQSCGATQIGAVESIGLALCAAYSSSMSITKGPSATGSSSMTSVPPSQSGSVSQTTASSTSSPSSTGTGTGAGGTTSAPSGTAAGSATPAPSGSSTSKGAAAKITGGAYAGAAVLGLVGAMVAL